MSLLVTASMKTRGVQGCPISEPAMTAADLHQVNIRLTAQPPLLEGAAPLAREPQSGLDDPFVDSLPADRDAVSFLKSLGCEYEGLSETFPQIRKMFQNRSVLISLILGSGPDIILS